MNRGTILRDMVLPWAAALGGGVLMALPFQLAAATHIVWLSPLPWLLLLAEGKMRRLPLLIFAGCCVYQSPLVWLTGVGISLLVALVLMEATSVALFAWAFLYCRRLGLPVVILGPVFWVTGEVLRLVASPLPTTWMTTGTILVRYPAVSQLSEWTGVFGLSALVWLVAGAITDAILAWRAGGRRALLRPGVAVGLTVAALAVGSATLYGEHRLRRLDLHPGPRIALVQAAVPVDVKNDVARMPEVFEKHAALTRSADLSRVDLVVWSETTLSTVLEGKAAWWYRVGALVFDIQRPLILGAFGLDRYPEGDVAPTNSAYLVTPEHGITTRWDKRTLLPPSETIPLLNRWPAARRAVGGFFQRHFRFYPFFVPGREAVVRAPREGLPAVGAMICYDDVVPGPSRDLRDAGARVLLVLTNEAWFAPSELAQHLEISRLRAIETRLPLLRAANTGRTAFVDPGGRVHAELPPWQTGVLVDTVLLTALEPPPRWAQPAFRWLALGAAAVLLVVALPRRRKESSPETAGGGYDSLLGE